MYVKLKRRRKNFVFLATSLTTKYSACVYVCVCEGELESVTLVLECKCVCICTVGLSSVNAIIERQTERLRQRESVCRGRVSGKVEVFFFYLLFILG